MCMCVRERECEHVCRYVRIGVRACVHAYMCRCTSGCMCVVCVGMHACMGTFRYRWL